MLKIERTAVTFHMPTWIQLHSFPPALWLWDTLWFSAFQHCPVPVCLRRMLPGLPVLLPHSSSGFWPGTVLTDWMVGDGNVFSPIVTAWVPELVLAGGRSRKRLCTDIFYITVMHVFVDTLDIFTWTRMCGIWWKALLVCRWPPRIPPQLSDQSS